MGVLFRLRVMEGMPGKSYLPHDVENPLQAATVDRLVNTCVIIAKIQYKTNNKYRRTGHRLVYMYQRLVITKHVIVPTRMLVCSLYPNKDDRMKKNI